MNTVILSMLFGPFAAGLASPFYNRLRRLWPERGVTAINLPDEPLRNHAIIAGGGTLARYVAAVLQESSTPFVIIEPLYQAFAEGKSAGLPMIYGEPGQESVLAVAGLSRARLVLFTDGDLHTMKELLALRRSEHLTFRALAKADRIEERAELLEAGFDAVVLPDLEGGLEMAHQSLRAMDHPEATIDTLIDRIRREATRTFTEEAASALPPT